MCSVSHWFAPVHLAAVDVNRSEAPATSIGKNRLPSNQHFFPICRVIHWQSHSPLTVSWLFIILSFHCFCTQTGLAVHISVMQMSPQTLLISLGPGQCERCCQCCCQFSAAFDQIVLCNSGTDLLTDTNLSVCLCRLLSLCRLQSIDPFFSFSIFLFFSFSIYFFQFSMHCHSKESTSVH